MNHEPLIVVDGVVQAVKADSTIDHVAAQRVMSRLDPKDIDTIEVLKGYAAVARYGPGAHEGALIITTKQKRTAPK